MQGILFLTSLFIMYSKQEASQLRQEFWTVFGQYLAPHLSAEGEKINWINYKTEIRFIQFTMQADKDVAMIAIVITWPDAGMRELYFEQFLQLKAMLHEELNEEWEWEPAVTDEYGKTTARISKQLHNASIYKKEDWAALISFFKPRIIALDSFWQSARYSFEALL